MSTMAKTMDTLASTKGRNIDNKIQGSTINQQIGIIASKYNLAWSASEMADIEATVERMIFEKETVQKGKIRSKSEYAKDSPQYHSALAKYQRQGQETAIKKIEAKYAKDFANMGLATKAINALIGIGSTAAKF